MSITANFERDEKNPIAVDSVTERRKPSGIALRNANDLPGGSRRSATRMDEKYATHDYELGVNVFLPRTGTIVTGIVLIWATVWLASMLGASPAGLLIATGASCFLVGTYFAIHGLVRWDQALSAYEHEHNAAVKWNDRLISVHSDSVRTGTVVSHMTDGVLMLSPNTEIMLINDAARRLLALPIDGVYLGRQFSELVRIPEIVDLIQRTRNENVDHNTSVEIIDGATVRPVSVRVDRIQDSCPPHLLILIQDETDSQRVEAIRREFIANVSHELKTPLAAIKGYAETAELAIDDDTDAAKHFIRQIDQQCLRLEDLIADMMRLARAQSGKGTLVIQAIDLRTVIQEAMNSFLPVAAAKQIDLSVVEHVGPVRVMADEGAALTITQNLVSNAIRHTEAGGRVEVSFRPERNGWTMAVQDDGVGIAPEFQERIFERFYRVKRSRATHDGGTGIGLAIVKNLTRGQGGDVGVISQPGKGATFEVWLPAAETDAVLH